MPLKLSVTGKGRIACTPACGKTIRGGEPLTLRAVPAKGFKFLRWSGACKGTELTCRPATDFALSRSRRVQSAALSQSRSSVGVGRRAPGQLAAQLADGARALGEHVVPVDRLQVDLA